MLQCSKQLCQQYVDTIYYTLYRLYLHTVIQYAITTIHYTDNIKKISLR